MSKLNDLNVKELKQIFKQHKTQFKDIKYNKLLKHELIKALEDKFGVTAAAPMMMGAMPAAGGAAAEPEEEQDEFDVVLTEAGGSAGFGHLMRCLAIANETDAELYVNADGDYPDNNRSKKRNTQ